MSAHPGAVTRGSQGWLNLGSVSAKKEKALGQSIPAHPYHR